MSLEGVRVIAHRGNSAALPENTMAAFRSAVWLGAHMIELDVRLSRDGVPVVVHDADLRRAAGLAARVRDMAAAPLMRLGVPALEEVLALPVAVDIELKEADAAPAVVDLAGQRDDVLLSSFDLDCLDFLRRLDGRLRLAYLARAGDWDMALERAAAAGAYAFNPPARVVTAGLAARARAAGLRLMTYTVNDVRQARELFELGVDAIFTDDPASMLAIL